MNLKPPERSEIYTALLRTMAAIQTYEDAIRQENDKIAIEGIYQLRQLIRKETQKVMKESLIHLDLVMSKYARAIREKDRSTTTE